MLAFGTGFGVLAASFSGALAYDLGTYPSSFVKDGKFSGAIVVGEKAATQDVLGSIDIAASLQGASLTKKATGTPTLAGDVKLVAGTKDQLELREPVGKVLNVMGAADLQALRGGSITTAEGASTYEQSLRFYTNMAANGAIGTSNQLQEFGVNFIDNRDGKMGDYLVMENTQTPVFEWQVQFNQGLKSKRESDGRLRDMEDRTINILGTDFTIVKAEVDSDGTDFKMTLMGGSTPDTLREGETKTYTIDGTDYEVTLVFVSDPASGGVPEVKLSVNGEMTKSLQRGDTDILSGNLQVGVRDILVNAREGVASFYLGANKVELSAPHTGTDVFETGGANINGQTIGVALLNVRGDVYSADKFELTSIKYRLRMNAKSGTDVYIAKGHGLRENLRYPQGLISPSLDIRYEGLTPQETYVIAFTPVSNDRYDFQFTNKQKGAYSIPLLSNRNGVFKFGDDRDDLVFVEASNETLPNVGLNDYFVTRNAVGDSATNVLRYDDIDTNEHMLYLTDLANGGQRRDIGFTQSLIDPSVGQGDLAESDHIYRIYIENWNTTGSHRLAIDQNGDSLVNNATMVFSMSGLATVSMLKITGTLGNESMHESVSLTSNAAFAQLVGDGKNFSNLNISTSVTNASALLTGNLSQAAFTNPVITWNLKTLSSGFDTNTGVVAIFNWTTSPATVGGTPQVTLGMDENSFTGPRMNQSSPSQFQHYRFTTNRDDSTKYQGMGDQGALVTEIVPTSSSIPNSLTFIYPKAQMLAQVYVTAGVTTTATKTVDTINPIAVGMAVLDKDAPPLGTKNMIVIGGPCANTVAASLMGNPADCAAGFTPGKALIKSWEGNGTVAILAAGYDAQDTLGASRVLAAYKDYNLKGDAVQLVVNDLSNIQVEPGR